MFRYLSIRKHFHLIGLLAVIPFLIECKKSSQIIVEGEGVNVYLEEADKMVSNSLHEYLTAIYDTRLIAAEEIINMKLLRLESHARGVTVDSLVSSEIHAMGKKITLEKYIRDNGLQDGVVDEAKPFNLFTLESEEGKKILRQSYEKHLKILFIESLHKKYKVRFLLTKPITPKVFYTTESQTEFEEQLPSLRKFKTNCNCIEG